MSRVQRVVFLGDSISTDDFTGAGLSWPSQLLAGLPRKFEIVNLAVSGRSLATIAGAGAILADVYQRLRLGPPTLLVNFSGTNDINAYDGMGAGLSGAQCLALETDTIGPLIRAVGAKWVTVATLPRGSPAASATVFNTQRGVYNAGKRVGTYHDGCADLDLVAALMDPTNPTYYADAGTLNTHLNAAGALLAANAIRPILLRHLA